ncbi:hypothetical protein J3R30DRAFT_3697299 [Lentinula aciculospora]|uniref:C2H2-type domain-containing protein n=1 Tax=Lentinula aciculospora TaxID=153920 RepID=A0A9W9APH3_9AGAR|nr:hypothetical protein J3R30DRAFT_3697299 [Lentinula aciculospora]
MDNSTSFQYTDQYIYEYYPCCPIPESLTNNTFEQTSVLSNDTQGYDYCHEPGGYPFEKDELGQEVQNPSSQAGTSYAPAIESTGPAKIGSSAGRAAADRRRVVHPNKGKTPSKYFCSMDGCGAHFTAKHNYHYHLDAHDKVKRFQCAVCKSYFPSMNNLKRHGRSCKGGKAALSA